MKKHGPYAINEIIERIRSGTCRMRSIKVWNEKDLPVALEYQFDGRWLPVGIYHKQAVRAAYRRLSYRFDEASGLGLYEVAA